MEAPSALHPSLPKRRRRHALNRLARAAWPLLVFLVALSVYGLTLAPTLTWSNDAADGGDLIAAASTLGVPHPSGYPTYVLFARLFLQALPIHEPAVRVHWLSALSAAAAALLLGLCVVESAQNPVAQGGAQGGDGDAAAEASGDGSREHRPGGDQRCPGLRLLVAPVVAGDRRRGTCAERCLRRGGPLAAAPLAVAWLGLGNHLTGLMLLPVVIVWFLVYGQGGRLRGRSRLLVGAGFLLGLAVYVYLPLAAVRRPSINWGDPQTWDRFWWVVTGQLYRQAILGVGWAQIPGRLSAWGHLLLGQFGWWGWLLAFVGTWRLSRVDRPALRASLFVFVAYSIYALTYDRADSYLYLLPASLIVAFWLGQGLVTLLSAVWAWGRQVAARRWCRIALRTVVVLLVASLPLLPGLRNFAGQDLRGDREAAEYATMALAAAEPGALIITSGDRTTFALWYQRYSLAGREDVAIVNASLWGFDWYQRTLAIHHPMVALLHGDGEPPELLEMALASLSLRPVYVTEEARDVVAGHPLEPSGPLYRLQPSDR